MTTDMPLDTAPRPQKSLAGQQAYQDGLAAEDTVCRDSLSRGYRFVADRWRGRCGEIDLIFEGEREYIFVEVRKARTLDVAATRLSHRQLHRIALSAQDYLSTTLEQPLVPMRLDLAMVDAVGQVSVVENLTLS